MTFTVKCYVHAYVCQRWHWFLCTFRLLLWRRRSCKHKFVLADYWCSEMLNIILGPLSRGRGSRLKTAVPVTQRWDLSKEENFSMLKYLNARKIFPKLSLQLHHSKWELLLRETMQLNQSQNGLLCLQGTQLIQSCNKLLCLQDTQLIQSQNGLHLEQSTLPIWNH